MRDDPVVPLPRAHPARPPVARPLLLRRHTPRPRKERPPSVTHHFKFDEILDVYDTFSRAAETKALKVIISR